MSYDEPSYIETIRSLPLNDLFVLLSEDVPFDMKNNASFYYSEIAYQIVSLTGAAKELLEMLIEPRSMAQAGAILMSLSAYKYDDQSIHDIIKRYISSDDPILISNAIESANRLKFKDLLDDVVAHKKSSDSYVYGSVLRFLSHHYYKLAKPLLLKALRSSDPIIIQNGIDELEEHGYVKGLDEIQQLTKHEHPHVRQAAEWAVKHLTKLKAELSK